MVNAKPYRNVVGLSQAKLERLLRNLDNLKAFGGDLFDRVVRYLLDGEDEAVLDELGRKPEAPVWVRLLAATGCGIGGGHPSWGAFLESIEPVDCRFYLRLGKLLAAAAQSSPHNAFFMQNRLDNNRWLEMLLQESTGTCQVTYSSEPPRSALSVDLIEEMLKVEDRPVEPFVTAAFAVDRSNRPAVRERDILLAVQGVGRCYAAHYSLLAPFFKRGPAASRQIAVENLARSKAPVRVFIEELVECATDSSKMLREAAESLLRGEPEAARAPLERAARDSNASKREHAVRLLGRIYGEGARAILEELQASEKTASVSEAIVDTLHELHNMAVVGPTPVEPAPCVPIDLNPAVTPSLRACLENLFSEYDRYAAEHNRRFAARTRGDRLYPRHPLPFVGTSSTDIDGIILLLEQGGNIHGILAHSLANARDIMAGQKGPFRDLLEHPDLHLIHLVRFLAMTRLLDPQYRGWGGMDLQASNLIDAYRRVHEPKVTLVNLAEAITSIGMNDSVLLHHILESYLPTFRWKPEAVWPFVWTKIRILEMLFVPVVGDWSARYHRERECRGAMRLLTTFPQVPPSLVGRLWEMAVGASKADRLRAQKIVVKLPDLPERLFQALAARGSETRAVAAEWIGRLGDRQYVAALHKAAKAEKIDAALDEMLTALERLGEDVEPYLDRDQLLADARKGLKKGTPPPLQWFPWEQLPKVRWEDSGRETPGEVVTWLIVQSFKLKSPEAGPLLRRYCALMRPADRAELGQFVLRAWLDQDMKRKFTDAECRAQAQQQAPLQFQQFQQALQYYQQQGQTPPASLNLTQQQIEESIFHQLQREVGTAANEKGILAVAGACCDASAVGPVQRYLKDWYGYRAAQCKAMIAMLSTIDHPSATQFLLSIANRFRTKGIREEAEKYVNLLAERKGWTLDELADRTLPNAGFEDDGTLELSFGPRQFRLRVTPNLEAVLTDGGGKTLKTLPALRKDDDEEQASAAKKAFSAAKADLKKFAAMQSTRLYEAMCTQRAWTVADWRSYLMGHPLMKFLCQRLVWAVCDGDRVVSAFRPLDDGSLTDYEDNELRLPTGANIRVAHSCHVPAETAAAWAAHLSDYDVSPLFTQFGRATYSLPAEKRKETAIDDFEGHLVEAFKLRSLATKLGYTRGPTQDGGWFFDYMKSFPGLGLKVVLEFSGNGLPEENRTVAVKQIYFQQASAEQEPMMLMQGGMALDEVPAVLLSESYNDLRAIAAAGTGFDPDWEKTVEF